jgi:hypothetical protein
MFNERVLQITEDIMLKWRLLVEEGRRAGHTFAQPDLNSRDGNSPRSYSRHS